MSFLTPHTVRITLVGSRLNVAFWLNQLEDIGTLTHVSAPVRVQGGIRVHAHVSRTVPLKGGPK